MTADDAAVTSTAASTTRSKSRTCIVVARHGARLDYEMRDAGENWITTTSSPWDTPVTDKGKQQGRLLGHRIRQLLGERGLPPISAVYSSPFHRCRQTAVAALEGLESDSRFRVRVEQGLAESLNESWYRSWCLPGSDGTWGFWDNIAAPLGLASVDEATIHPIAKTPVQSILTNWCKDEDDTFSKIDVDYMSTYSIDTPYKWGTFESRRKQRERMYSVIQALAKQHVGESILLVSHGGPVTHLYERITGNHWAVHGESSYGCFSLYAQIEGGDDWEPLIVNESSPLT